MHIEFSLDIVFIGRYVNKITYLFLVRKIAKLLMTDVKRCHDWIEFIFCSAGVFQ